MRAEPVAPSIADGRVRQLGGVQHAGAQGVVDVVVDVRHAVDELDDAALERLRRDRPGVVEDAVAHLVREVEAAAVALEHVDDAQRVLVVAEAALEALAQRAVEPGLAGVPEGRVPEIVAEADGLGEVLVEAQRAGDRARDPDGLERVREPRAVVVALGRHEDLRLVLEAPERLAVGDAVAVALKGAAQPAGHLGHEPAARLRRAHGERREAARLLESRRSRKVSATGPVLRMRLGDST